MTTAERPSLPPWLPPWWPRYALAVSVIAVVALVLGVWGVYTNGKQDAVAAAENKGRDQQNARLLGCFNEYAKASSESSTAVRVASVHKDAATSERDDTLNEEGRAFLRVVDHILADNVTPQDVQNLRDSLRLRAAAAAKLDHAQAALDQARADNPVPPPPSTFCSDH